MDMKKELQQVQIENNDSVLNMRKSMEKERDDLEKKIYIFRAIEIANAIVEMINSDVEDLYSRNVYGIFISQNLDTDFDRHRFYFGGVDKDGKSIRLNDNGFSMVYNSKFMKIEEMFSPYKEFGYAPECCKYGPDSSKIFMFSEKENLKEELLDFLLSDELKSIFEYNKMQLSLGTDNKVKPKSSKV